MSKERTILSTMYRIAAARDEEEFAAAKQAYLSAGGTLHPELKTYLTLSGGFETFISRLQGLEDRIDRAEIETFDDMVAKSGLPITTYDDLVQNSVMPQARYSPVMVMIRKASDFAGDRLRAMTGGWPPRKPRPPMF